MSQSLPRRPIDIMLTAEELRAMQLSNGAQMGLPGASVPTPGTSSGPGYFEHSHKAANLHKPSQDTHRQSR